MLGNNSKQPYTRFQMCSCGAVGIDGGILDGNRTLGNLRDMENRSMYCAIVQNKKIWLSQSQLEEHNLTNN